MNGWAGFWIGGGFALGCAFLSVALIDFRAHIERLVNAAIVNAVPWMVVVMKQAQELDALAAATRKPNKRKPAPSPSTSETPPK